MKLGTYIWCDGCLEWQEHTPEEHLEYLKKTHDLYARMVEECDVSQVRIATEKEYALGKRNHHSTMISNLYKQLGRTQDS